MCNRVAFGVLCTSAIATQAFCVTLDRMSDSIKTWRCKTLDTGRAKGLAQGVLRNSLLGEYFVLAVVVHAAFCACAWSFAALQEPASVGLVLGCVWIFLRTTDCISGNLISLLLSLALACVAIALCYRESTALPNIGLLAAFQPSVCLAMLLFVLVLDVFEWRRNGQTK